MLAGSFLIAVNQEDPITGFAEVRMDRDYGKANLTRLGFDFESSILARAEAYLTLSRKDVLGIVQSAFDELGADDPALVATKRDVLTEVSEGKLAHAVRTAIVGAGKSCCPCCR
jgi:hypothetical protein